MIKPTTENICAAIASMAMQMQQGADCELRRAEKHALKAMLNHETEANRVIAFGAYEMHRAYTHCTRTLDGLRKRIDAGDMGQEQNSKHDDT